MNRARRLLSFAIVISAAMESAIGAADRLVVLDPAKSTVTFTLDATADVVEGVLALESGKIKFDPETGSASGDVVVRLAGGTTGNQRRDRKMHKGVLETWKFPSATFRLSKVTGTFLGEGESNLGLEGVLSFHGADRPLIIPAHVTARGGKVTAKLDVTIPYVAWGLHDPSVFVLGVAKEVTVDVVAEGTLR